MFPALGWGTTVRPIIGVGADAEPRLEGARRLPPIAARSSREAGSRAPRPNRSSIRSIARSTSPQRSPCSIASCSAPAGTRPVGLHPQQPDPPALPRQRAVELGDHVVQIGADIGGVGERPGPGERREVRQAGLQGDRSGAVAVGAQAGRHPSREVQQLPQDVLVGVQVALERLLVAHRLRRLVRDHVAVVDAVRELVEVMRRRLRRAGVRGWTRACGPGRRSCGSPVGRASRRSSPPRPTDARPAAARGTLEPLRREPRASRSACSRRTRAWRRTSWERRRRSTSPRPRAPRRPGSSPRSRPRTRTAWWRPRRPGTPRRARSAPRAGCRSSRTSRNRWEWAR